MPRATLDKNGRNKTTVKSCRKTSRNRPKSRTQENAQYTVQLNVVLVAGKRAGLSQTLYVANRDGRLTGKKLKRKDASLSKGKGQTAFWQILRNVARANRASDSSTYAK